MMRYYVMNKMLLTMVTRDPDLLGWYLAASEWSALGLRVDSSIEFAEVKELA